MANPRLWHVTAKWQRNNKTLQKDFIISCEDKETALQIANNRSFDPVHVTRHDQTQYRARDLGSFTNNRTYYSSDIRVATFMDTESNSPANLILLQFIMMWGIEMGWRTNNPYASEKDIKHLHMMQNTSNPHIMLYQWAEEYLQQKDEDLNKKQFFIQKLEQYLNDKITNINDFTIPENTDSNTILQQAKIQAQAIIDQAKQEAQMQRHQLNTETERLAAIAKALTGNDRTTPVQQTVSATDVSKVDTYDFAPLTPVEEPESKDNSENQQDTTSTNLQTDEEKETIHLRVPNKEDPTKIDTIPVTLDQPMVVDDINQPTETKNENEYDDEYEDENEEQYSELGEDYYEDPEDSYDELEPNDDQLGNPLDLNSEEMAEMEANSLNQLNATLNHETQDLDYTEATPEKSQVTDEILKESISQFKPNILLAYLPQLTYVFASDTKISKINAKQAFDIIYRSQLKGRPDNEWSNTITKLIADCLPIHNQSAIKYIYTKLYTGNDEEEID